MNNKQTTILMVSLLIAVAIFFVYWNNDKNLSMTQYKPNYQTSEGTLFGKHTYDVGDRQGFYKNKKEQLNKNNQFLIFGLISVFVIGGFAINATGDKKEKAVLSDKIKNNDSAILEEQDRHN